MSQVMAPVKRSRPAVETGNPKNGGRYLGTRPFVDIMSFEHR
jgi:hypothetical protein